jgi:hypothetical protein
MICIGFSLLCVLILFFLGFISQHAVGRKLHRWIWTVLYIRVFPVVWGEVFFLWVISFQGRVGHSLVSLSSPSSSVLGAMPSNASPFLPQYVTNHFGSNDSAEGKLFLFGVWWFLFLNWLFHLCMFYFQGLSSVKLNDLWEYDLKTNLWRELLVVGDVPCPRYKIIHLFFFFFFFFNFITKFIHLWICLFRFKNIYFFFKNNILFNGGCR